MQDDKDSFLSELLQSTHDSSLLPVELESAGVIRPNNENLDYYEQELSIGDIEEINDFVSRAERSKKIARFILAPTYAQISRNEYSEFRGEIYDSRSNSSLEGFAAFRVKQQDEEAKRFPAIDNSFI
ncbi:hypothetical protein KBC51_02850, partial [Candidatus Saccharibacteria bacterium]|nr:hypothetical protein [Candidatus Saccharibacteria bacterium]